MLTLVSQPIEDYCRAHTTQVDPLLEELKEYTYTHTSQPQMLIGQLEGTFLRMLISISGAKRVLEIGTFTGYSALSMAMGLPADGQLITLDVNHETTALARSFWDRSPHGNKIVAHTAPALETLEKLDGPFDLVFIDADKGNYTRYWEAILPKMKPGGLLVADNVLWSGRILEPQSPSDHALRDFADHVKQDARVECVMLSIRDGMLVCRKLGL